MRKESRLSFRISNHLDRRIDKALDMAQSQIRDRSEFGTKAIKFYLDYIENTQSEEELILKSIVALSEKVGLQHTSEIDQITKLLDEKTLIPSVFVSTRNPEDHPDYAKLVGLYERITDNYMKKQLTQEITDALYDDIGELYQKYADAFFLGIKVQ